MTSEIRKVVFIFGGSSVLILLLFQLEKWSLFAVSGSDNLHLIVSGVLFLILGIILSRFFYFKSEVRKQEFLKSSLSKQELRVLQLMAEGLSNKEISKKLFIAETTVKSHVSKVLSKLEAKRRTEAIKIGRDANII